jgi:hypothetical protein
MRNLIATISFLLLGSLAYAQDDLESRGPLETRGYTIFQLSAFEFTTPLPTHLSENGTLFKSSATWTNVFNVHDSRLTVDSELLRVDNRIFYGVTDRLMVGISVPFTAVGGGGMDTFIEGFHDTFGFSNDTRHKYPRNNFSVNGSDYSSDILISDVTAHVRYRLFDNPGLSVGLRIQTPSLLTTEWFNHHQFGVGIDLTGFYDLDTSMGNFYFTAMASIARLGETSTFGYSLVPYQTSFLAGVDWRPFDSFSFILQCSATSGCIDAFDYRRWSFEVAAGFRLQTSNHMWVDLGITENLINLENSADVGIYLGVTFRY